MNDLLQPYLQHFVLVFFDDMLIFSANISDHLQHLVVFNLLQEHKFYAKLVNCVFIVATISYLGHITSSERVKPNPNKIQAMIKLQRPHSITSLCGFLGLTGFYRCFIKQYTHIAFLLTEFLKVSQFAWS